MIKSISRQQGFTLLELFVALSIGLFLFAGVMSVFVGLRTTSAETSSYGEMRENGRFAISLLTDDLMRVGFWGELSGDLNQSVLQNIGDVSSSVSQTETVAGEVQALSDELEHQAGELKAAVSAFLDGIRNK